MYQGRKLWFCGHNIVLALIDELKSRYGLANAEELIVTGTSAGGLATVMLADLFQSVRRGEEGVNFTSSSQFYPPASAPAQDVCGGCAGRELFYRHGDRQRRQPPLTEHVPGRGQVVV